MAVIQISKIQLRRGKEQEEGIPQLASGEMAWAIDTQKLFIGNGAVSEGAPQVGNTRLLTDKDNIFELAQDYQYREGNSSIQTGLSVNYPVQITLQEKLDEKVTNVEYGILSNGQDQAANIQNAIDNLFLNPAYLSRNDLRVTLEFLPGTYLISTTIFLPSNVTIVGAGVDKTVFQFTGLSQPAFRFINDSSTKTSRSTLGSTTYINQPKNVFLKGFTVQTGDPTVNGFQMDAVRDSVFEDVRVVGSYGDSGTNQSKGLDISALSSIVTTQRNHFERMKFDGMKYSVASKYDIRDNIWSNCEFVDGFIAVNFGEGTDLSSTGQLYGPRSNVITDSIFSNIDREGIRIVNGHGNRSFGNIFSNVGNLGGGNTNNQTAIIRFDTNGNSSSSDSFDRRLMPYDTVNDLSSNNFSEVYLAEVQGRVFQDMTTTNRVVLNSTTAPIQFMRVPVDSDSAIEISYLLKSVNANAPQFNQVRKGKIHLVVDYQNIDLVQQHVRLVDEYEFVGEEFDDDNIVFTASISLGNVFVSYVNFNSSDTSVFEYKYKYIN